MRKTVFEPMTLNGKKPRCQEEVCDYSMGGWPRWHQCSRAAVVGDRCKQHDPVAVQARKDKTEAKAREDWRKRGFELYGKQFYNVLVQIAEGHNDPRALAREEVDKMERWK